MHHLEIDLTNFIVIAQFNATLEGDQYHQGSDKNSKRLYNYHVVKIVCANKRPNLRHPLHFPAHPT